MTNPRTGNGAGASRAETKPVDAPVETTATDDGQMSVADINAFRQTLHDKEVADKPQQRGKHSARIG